MPRVTHDEITGHPRLARTLRWLRHRSRITQAELRERVVRSGESVSVIYIQQLEAGRRRPRPVMLDVLLDALDSSRDEVRALLDQDELHDATPGAWRPRRDALAAGVTWSDPVALHPSGPAVDDTGAIAAEILALAEEMSASQRSELLARAREIARRVS